MIDCYLCGPAIPNGEVYMTVNYQLERSDVGGVTIDHAESLLTARIDCAPPRESVVSSVSTIGQGG